MALFTFDNLEVPNADLKIDYSNIENTALSEAGTVVGTLTRALKRSYVATVKCTGDFLELLKAKGRLTSAFFTYDGETFDAMLRIKSAALVKYSFDICESGLYTVSLTITEV